MTEIVLTIDGRQVKAEAGMTVLQAAQQAGIYIPTLCHHEKLEAFGGCRLCMVEVESRGWTSYVVSCLYPVAKDIIVRSRSEKVDKIRKVLVEELMAHAPDAPELVKLAEEYGADRNRFEKEASFCVLCGLCVRYCNEVKKKNAVSFFDNGSVRLMAPRMSRSTVRAISLHASIRCGLGVLIEQTPSSETFLRISGHTVVSSSCPPAMPQQATAPPYAVWAKTFASV